MIYLLVRLSIIDNVIKNKFVNQLNLSMDFDLKSQQSDMEATHKDVFTGVCAIVDNTLIKEGGIIKLSDLREIYVSRLEKTPFVNP